MAKAVASNGAETRLRIMDAAVEAFGEKGFHGTTTRDIAKAAGLSPAAVYVHFDSKEALLFEISLAGHETTLQVVAESQAGVQTPQEALASWVAAFAGHHAREHAAARVVNYELHALSPEHWTTILDKRRALDAQLSDIIQRGVDDGVFGTADVRAAARSISSLGIDIARWYRPDGPISPGALGREHARIALLIVECRDRAAS